MPTPYEIYQTYLRGPAAVIRLFEQVFGTLALYGPPEPDQQQRTIESQAEQLDHLRARLSRLEHELWEAQQDNHRLRQRHAELEAVISRDSHNSSRPPSSDPTWAKRTRSLRRPSGKSPGGQMGHPGHTHPLTANPARLFLYRPRQCRHCLGPLADGQIMGSERRQVIEIVPAKLRVIEHRAEVVRCSGCGQRTKGTFPQGVRAALQYGPSVMARALYLHDYQLLPYHRTSQAMRDLFGCQMSPGTLSRGVSGCARQLVETELQIKRKLRRASVIHADETGLRVEQKCHYVHVASTQRLTHYGYDARRGRAAMDEINILPRFRGTCVHDGWLSYTYYEKCQHALCGAHLLRELTYFSELDERRKRWAEPIKQMLLEIKREVEEARAGGGEQLRVERVALLITGYEQQVQKGLKANPPPARADLIGRQARNLLLRLERRKEEVLRLMTDFSVGFDNNQAERDLRMIKLRQKISGCFRSREGARQFCRLRSYLWTMSKQGKGMMRALERACAGRPLRPTS
jgi:transposase